ncbi:hypothetical protein H3C67_04445 [Candidatus Dojkabacteria bacterium]|uniref:Uncharacterized protein n=1 Tax=Candidatus Dojkabacteria bacterium TaxID=2099670 RepID=A0A952AL32_9BACT|nr:hypothetical protein [Candidatus Dojkabacteria bacterium]
MNPETTPTIKDNDRFILKSTLRLIGIAYAGSLIAITVFPPIITGIRFLAAIAELQGNPLAAAEFPDLIGGYQP